MVALPTVRTPPVRTQPVIIPAVRTVSEILAEARRSRSEPEEEEECDCDEQNEKIAELEKMLRMARKQNADLSREN